MASPKVEVSVQPQKTDTKENSDKQKPVEEKKSIFSPGLMLGVLSFVLIALGWKEKMNFLIS